MRRLLLLTAFLLSLAFATPANTKRLANMRLRRMMAAMLAKNPNYVKYAKKVKF